MSGRYRATINGFWCRTQTWDIATQDDGKGDEILLVVNTKVVDSSGAVLQNFDQQSELMGDTWLQPNRVQAGSASDRGGIITGDKFPAVPTPWLRSGALNAQRFPPYSIWEGELHDDDDTMVLLTPTIWEWDPGAGFWDGWLQWQVSVDAQYGQRAKEIFGKVWPVSMPVFDAVSLGIQTVGSLAGLWSPLGRSMRRPIGTRRNPDDPNGFLFNPKTIALNADTAEYLTGTNVQGLGNGIVEIPYEDDPQLRGVYSLWVQIEKITEVDQLTLQSEWRWCDKCQGLFFGPAVANSSCPTGGTHDPAALSGSGNYSLPHNVAPDPTRQTDWRWCDKCQGLFFGPNVTNSRCPTGATHTPPEQSHSGNYSLPHNVAPDPSRQSDWRWCDKCQGLFFGPNVASSRCPTGATHTPPEQSHSGNYSLYHIEHG